MHFLFDSKYDSSVSFEDLDVFHYETVLESAVMI